MSDELTSFDKRQWPEGCWPNEEQRHLLRACVIANEQTARDAFLGWKATTPFCLVDLGSKRLLLTLYQRLKQWQIEGEPSAHLKAAVRSLWIQQQAVESHLGNVLDTLNGNHIDSILLKGAALNHLAYPHGDRLMTDLDLVVPKERAGDALKALEEDGWIPQFRNPDQLIAVTHGCHFRKGSTGHVDLHWDFFHGRHLTESQREELWDRSIPVERFGRVSRILGPADQFLHTCEHGLRYSEVAPLRWLLDAVMIIRRAGDELDWRRVQEMARSFELILPLLETLEYLEEHLGTVAPVDTDALGKSVSQQESKGHPITTRRHAGGQLFWGSLPTAMNDYRRLRPHTPQLSLSEYLARVNDLEPPVQRHLLPLLLIRLAGLGYPLSQRLLRSYESSIRRRKVRVFHVANLGIEAVEGFHSPEIFLGRSFRWSLPVAIFRLPLPPQGGQIDIGLLRIRKLPQSLIDQLEVRVNDCVSPAPNPSISLKRRRLSLEIPSSHCHEHHLQRIELHCPAWDLESNDQRKLGLPMTWIRCIPAAE